MTEMANFNIPRWRDYCYEGNWAERKAKRVYCYTRFEYKNKLRTCSSCSGSGWYDGFGNPKCGGCEGTGKVRER